MKISKFNRPRERVVGGSRKSKRLVASHSPFMDALEYHQVDEMDFNMAIESVDEYARKLKQSPTFSNLKRYKDAVRALLHVMVGECYHVEEKSFFDRQGRRRIYMLVDKIDQKLEELTRLFLARQTSSLELVNRLDEIRGMLLDIYS